MDHDLGSDRLDRRGSFHPQRACGLFGSCCTSTCRYSCYIRERWIPVLMQKWKTNKIPLFKDLDRLLIIKLRSLEVIL